MAKQQTQSRLPIGAAIFFALMIFIGAYFAFNAVQGKFGLLRRVQVNAELQDQMSERDRLQAEVDQMANLTRRLSDNYLDLDLLDERARDVLGLARGDDAIIR
ncbi:FtsB family cell division protein [Paracoccus pacificus]|uniref:Septum formation initiator family protein n=1 Tax=Paracoccus pacificus TaxID=1463598 RepID=A0ABW4RAQ9_9RHOB